MSETQHSQRANADALKQARTENFSVNRFAFNGDARVFMIAEIGVNHNGSASLAHDLIRAARRAGADCIKFQTFRSDRVASETAPKAAYQIARTGKAESQLTMLRRLELAPDVFGALLETCRSEGVLFSSTPYNEEDIAFLDDLQTPFFKAASMHCAEPRFLQKMAETGRPLIVSTGMANWAEVDNAVAAIRATGNEDFALLQCTTNYPSAPSEANLRAMAAMHNRYGCVVGYSDHTLGHTACLAAVALGARIIERHFTLDRSLAGPDHSASDDPEMFATLAAQIREVEAALGDGVKRPSPAEQSNMAAMRRSLVARRLIVAGQVVTDDDLSCRRPADGLAPRLWSEVVGKTARHDVAAGAQLRWDYFDD